MSSLATPRPERPTAAVEAAGALRLTGDARLGIALAAGLVLIAFITGGGSELGPNTWTEIVLIALGALAAAAVVFYAAPGRPWGAGTLALFGLLVALTAASIGWSVQPDDSWNEAGRTLSYLAVFGAGIALARLMPARWSALPGAIAVAAGVISAYALLVKVFPAALDSGGTLGRLRAPFDYWNATGLIAAMGLPACLWVGARRDRGRLSRGLAVPTVSVLLSVIVLSYSRGAIVAAIAGLIAWFALTPLRLRGALILALGLAGAAIIAGYALATHALTANLVPLQARSSSGHAFGVLLVLVLALLSAVGLAAAFAMDRIALSALVRRRVATALLVLVALLPVAGVGALAASSRGLTGEVSHVWSTLTSPYSGVGNSATRLIELGNSRGHYWRLGLTVGKHHLLAGAGAAGYGTAARRYAHDPRLTSHAHSYAIETFADFGLIGVVLMLAMLVAWLLAARRPLSRPAPARSAEYAGAATIFSVVLVFGVHSSIDWTWFVPGTAIPALLCAGWLAGRGDLAHRVGTQARRRSLGAIAASLAIAAAALLGIWAVWQPLRSANADDSALSALSSGHTAQAITDARAAADRDPVSIDPPLELAAIYSALSQPELARAQLLHATRIQPQNAQSWLALGEFELSQHRPTRALYALRRAYQLDLSSAEAAAALERAVTAKAA